METYRTAAPPESARPATPDAPPRLPSALRPQSRAAWRATRGAYLGVGVTPVLALSLLVAVGAFGEEAPPAAFGWAALGGMALVYVYYARAIANVRRGRELDRRNGEAIRLIDVDPAQAIEELGRLADDSRRLPLNHSVYLMNLGVALLRGGHAGQALDVLRGVERAGWLATTLHASTLATNLTTAAVIDAKLPEAERWMRVSEARTPASKRALLLLNQALLATRRDRFDEAVRLVDGGMADAARVLTAHSLELLQLVRAYALARLGDTTRLGEALAAVKDTPRSRFLHWTKQWPELGAFVRDHDVGR